MCVLRSLNFQKMRIKYFLKLIYKTYFNTRTFSEILMICQIP